MEKNVRVEPLKDYEKCETPYYVKEIAPYIVNLKKRFKPGDVECLGTSATDLGMSKIRARTSAGKYIVEFLNKSTIHGLNHIAASHRHFIERILTVLFLAVAFGCLAASSISSWYQYQNNPTSMVVDFDYANFNITKPAVTVCLNDKVQADKFPGVFKKFGVKDTQEARNFFLFIASPSYKTLNQLPIYNDTAPEKWLEILRDLYGKIDEVPCTDEVNSCVVADYGSFGTDIVTEKGICTTLFGAYSPYASVDYWLSNNWTVFPQNTLPVYTYSYRNERFSLNNISRAFEESMTFHHPKELPQYSDSWLDLKKPEIVDAKITALEVESTEYLKKLSPMQRPCNYPDDGTLKMWPVYTRNMCELECRHNSFKSTCGCYPHFARPMPGVPICNATQLHCVGNVEKEAISLKKRGVNYCICRDSCDIARYKVISQVRTEFNEKSWSKGATKFVNTRVLSVDLQFPYFKLRYEVFFGYNEFLVGGAAGLFLGASIISIVEIVYYMTLRFFWYKNNISKRKRGSSNFLQRRHVLQLQLN